MAANIWAQEQITVDYFKYQILNDDEVSFIGVDTAGRNAEITIPSTIVYQEKTYTVVSIGERAFESCTWLKDITIPNTVREIEYRAFRQTRITSVQIPASVTSIIDNPFLECINLTTIVVDSNNPIYDSRDDCNAIIETASNTLITGCKNTVIPNTVTSIGAASFFNLGINTSVNIPNSVTSIGDVAFYGNSMPSVEIPVSLTNIVGRPFIRCGITSIKVAEGNPVYDSRNNCNAIIETATNTLITGCNNTEIPNGITSIADSAFWWIKGMTSINIPNSVTTIGKSAFNGCSGMTSINIPYSVTNIDEEAFYQSGLTSINIPNSVTTIKARVFKFCSDLASVSIPNTITTIEYEAFNSCSKLTSVVIPNSVSIIAARAFSSCSSLTSIYIPASVTSIGNNPFVGCTSLASIIVSEENPVYDSRNNCNAIIETATNTLISGCVNSKIPNDIVKIATVAFNYCKGLTSINIPNSVTTIDGYAFDWCDNLSSINIDSGVTTIGERAFSNSGLVFIACSAKNPPNCSTTTWVYAGSRVIPSIATLYVPCYSYDAYASDAEWGKFANIECRFTSEPKTIPDITIEDGDKLPMIELSDYFEDEENITYTVSSSNNGVVYPAVMNDKLGFIQYGTGTATITVYATIEPMTISRSFTFTINSDEPQPECNELQISAKKTVPTCFGGEDGKIAVSVSGGTEPYYYKWNNGRTDGTLSGVSAGTYSVLVADGNGCTAEKSFTITETDSITITEKLTKPTCRKSNGKITLNITGGTEPYTYLWNLPKNRIDVAKDLENLQSESYIINVTDKNSCKASKTINLPDNGAPTVKLKSVEPSKCHEATGSIEVEVSGGSSYSWSDSANVNKLIRPKLFPGNYTFKVNDNNGCRATMLVTVPMQQFRQPEISLVSYGDTAGHNLVIWQKEQTDEIEKYYVFRETKDAGNYDRIGSLAYNETSIYVDETANFNATSCRYRISAANQCGESQLSYAYRTMRLQRKRVDGGLLLWWNSYEGFEFVKYTLYRLTNEGLEKYAELPANKYRYTVKELDPNTIGFFVTVELTEIVDVNKPMKAEGGPFAIAFSNLAEVENADAIEEVEENQAVVYSKDKKIIIVNAQNKNIFVCDVTGKIVAQRKNVDSAEIPVQSSGVYVVIVGKNVFKVIVE